MSAEPPPPPQLSPDGKFYLDGQDWMPVRRTSPPLWPWVGIGLVTAIPVVVVLLALVLWLWSPD